MDDYFPPPPPESILYNEIDTTRCKNFDNDISLPPPPPPKFDDFDVKHFSNKREKLITPYAENTIYLKNYYNDNNLLKILPVDESEDKVDQLTDMLIQNLNMDPTENIGICAICNLQILNDDDGCTALGKLYHILCFKCDSCEVNLQGQSFYIVEDLIVCEEDYMKTLEKCSTCSKPITNRILRATGKPYHPGCFVCVVCGLCLDGIPFTLDASNQVYCITDFHEKFAPRCAICNYLIVPNNGESETIRIIAMDKSFHVECYKCQDCSMPLTSSENEICGKTSSCYPLDDWILCKSCNTARINFITSHLNANDRNANETECLQISKNIDKINDNLNCYKQKIYPNGISDV
ncbi:unnamed protein product [Gordionus sp. m RMFG-2023]|uniref:thyroid receptor-interacting protein 6-like isoform X2 n=1 Tax=Gordionus sp. m RMFG-2023 TaxID=3053472 RepID=UPI0030E1860C